MTTCCCTKYLALQQYVACQLYVYGLKKCKIKLYHRYIYTVYLCTFSLSCLNWYIFNVCMAWKLIASQSMYVTGFAIWHWVWTHIAIFIHMSNTDFQFFCNNHDLWDNVNNIIDIVIIISIYQATLNELLFFHSIRTAVFPTTIRHFAPLLAECNHPAPY